MPLAIEPTAEQVSEREHIPSCSSDIKRIPTSPSSNEVQHLTKEETYWEKQVFWQRVSTLVTIGAFAAAAVYACIAHQQLATMRDQLNSSERPWVTLGQATIVQNLSYGHPMMLSFAEQNGGKSPALYVIPHALLRAQFEATNGLQPLRARLPDNCVGALPKWNTNLAGGAILLPGSSEPYEIVGAPEPNWIVDAVTNANAKVPWPLPAPIPPYFFVPPNANMSYLRETLTGCIDYFDEFHTAHRTTFCDIYMPAIHNVGRCGLGNDAN